MIDDYRGVFTGIFRKPFKENSIAGNIVTSMAEDGNSIWVGTDGYGISIWNRETGHFAHHNQFANRSITSILNDSNGNFWVGTFGGGIYKFNKSTKSFQQFRCINKVTGHENKIVLRIYEDKENNIWATTYENDRLYKFNKESQQFEVFDQTLGDLFSLCEDSNGNLWAGSFFELIRIDRINKNHQHYYIGRTVRAIFEDSRKNLFVGAEGSGLLLIDAASGRIKESFSEEDGLCNNTVLNILEDGSRNLWMSTFNGLSKFDPSTKKFINFYESDGLLSSQFTYRGALKLQNGELAFGSVAGLNMFNPAFLQYRANMPTLNITEIRVNNQPLKVGEFKNIEFAQGVIKSLTLPFNKAFLSFDFAALDYSTPDKIEYAYFLDGWDKSWNYTKNRSVTYNNIWEGHYTLRIKSTNSWGEWNTKETILNIRILPPWYRSWWAYLLYFTVVVSGIHFYLRYQANKHKLEYEVKYAKQTAQNEKELSERKASFFTNISHEFRTLLTLIVNPINELMLKDQEEKPFEIQVAYNNSRRMLSLLDQLLLFRKVSSENSDLAVSEFRIYDLCKEVFDSFQYQARSKNINYQLMCDDDTATVFVDAEKIEIALFNLISNALKYAPHDGFVNVTIRNTTQEAVIAVEDNGSGFSEKVGNNIFTPYYQVQSLEFQSKPGFGIGLNLVKSFVDLHKGKVHYKSEEGKGTTFFISFLKGIQHFPAGTTILKTPITEKAFSHEIFSAISPAEPIENHNLEAIASGKKQLMIVDDDPELLSYVKNIFQKDYSVIEANNGLEAVKIVEKLEPDIIITDLKLHGGLNGDELCSKIKNDPRLKHIPVLLLTGEDSANTKLRCIESGAEDYILKPFDQALLLAKVKNLLASQSNLRQYFLNHVTMQEQNLKISESEKNFLDACIKAVEEHLYDDQFAISILANELGMSHSNLYKKIKQLSGHSINSFVRMIRLRRAADILINSTSNVNEAAAEVGFNDIKHFRAQFVKLFGYTPSEYIKKYRKTFQGKYTVKRSNKNEREA